MTGWQADALCAQVGFSDLWFPEKGGSTADAKRVCADCDVRAECLAFALDNNIHEGVWGGMSVRDRRRIAAGLDPQELRERHARGAA